VVCVVEYCEDLPIRLKSWRRGECPRAIAVIIAHSAVRGGQIRVDLILTLYVFRHLAVRGVGLMNISVGPWRGSECRMPLCVLEELK